MMKNDAPQSQKQETWAVTARWGDLSGTGFTVVPNTLIKAQDRLGLSSNDVVVILNFLMHWWQPDALPFPRTSTIAKRSGLSTRTVQRSMSKLQRQGYFKKRTDGDRIYIDPAGLRDELVKLSEEFSWSVENTQASRLPRDGKVAGHQSGEPSKSDEEATHGVSKAT